MSDIFGHTKKQMIELIPEQLFPWFDDYILRDNKAIIIVRYTDPGVLLYSTLFTFKF